MVPRRSASTYTEIVNNEMCVYEWTRGEVHALNPTAARIWQLCDGSTTPSEMAAALGAELDRRLANELVWLALEEFKGKSLIEDWLAIPPVRRRLSRRTLMQSGLTVAMLPVVSSIVAPAALQAQSLNSQTFDFTGGVQTFMVPAGMTSIGVDAYGAMGGVGEPALSSEGKGGRVQARLSVSSGDALTVNVGGAGGHYFSPGFGGFNGGGTGGALAGGGGGASDVRRGAVTLLVAGGGGGTGRWYAAAGLGGGGYFGGGGGGGSRKEGGKPPGETQSRPEGGSGGGGSSYTIAGATSVIHTQGVRNGHGQVIITW